MQSMMGNAEQVVLDSYGLDVSNNYTMDCSDEGEAELVVGGNERVLASIGCQTSTPENIKG